MAGYYFPETLPSFGYRLPEILSVLLYESFIPNAKNLWARLLAETGIVGFSVFVFNLRACDVHRLQVGGELHAAIAHLNGLRQ